MTIYIGIDNGVSGSIGILEEGIKPKYIKMPIKKHLDYTKKEKWIHRIKSRELLSILIETIRNKASEVKIFLERPMVNPMMFNNSLSAVRALEATLIVLEELVLRKEYIDSKQWQKSLLPELRDKKNRHAKLKKLSLEIGKRLFPSVDFKDFKDADGLLIAEFARREKL